MPNNLGAAEVVEPEETSAYSGAQLAEDLLKAPIEQEAEPAAERVTKEEFNAQAEDIFASLDSRKREGTTRSKAFAEVYNAYVVEEDNPKLRFQAEIILGASQINLLSHEIEAIYSRLDDHTATSEDKKRFPRLREAAATYDHALREFIMTNQSELRRSDIKSWLTLASDGDQLWASQTVNGVAAEIAMLELFDGDPSVTMLATSVEQDVHDKTDMVAVHQDGRRVAIDVKHGRSNRPHSGVGKSSSVQFEVVPSQLDDAGFTFKPHLVEENRRQILRLF